eukprot:TRINITY_DN14524_c0_g1_i1.p1 TRINITY_DN14524_c0_g1~~TRINITY_DN14524_c0_g1_i1.p1  ORF type:complete len:152 (+),score=45.04 TRINITY_DN14524_c0_g1_i1:98-553(+)
MMRAALESTLVRGGNASTPGRALRGLYHGKSILSGNSVSFSMRKTKRRWLPNVAKRKLYSELLGRSFRIQISTRALKCIDKAGGLDEYILHTKPERFHDSDFAVTLREVLLDRHERKHGTKLDRRTREFQHRLRSLAHAEAEAAKQGAGKR